MARLADRSGRPRVVSTPGGRCARRVDIGQGGGNVVFGRPIAVFDSWRDVGPCRSWRGK